MKISDSSSNTETLSADVLVIGAGGAGLSAAVAAAERGKKVIVLEKRLITGGNSIFAEGLFAAESPVQRRLGIDADSDELFRMATEYAHWNLNTAVVRAFIEKSSDTIRWLEEKGLKFHSVPPLYPRQLIRTWHCPDRGGSAVIDILFKYCHRLGVRLLFGSTVRKILKDDSNGVAGVLVSANKTNIRINTKCIIIATGGYAGNKNMLKKYCHFDTEKFISRGLPLKGDGINLAIESGAGIEGMGKLQLTGPYFPYSPVLMDAAREPDSIWVNKNGKRFVNETAAFHPPEGANAVIRQPEMTSYTLLDSEKVQSIINNGFNKISLGVLYGREAGPIPALADELRKQSMGIATIVKIDPELCSGCGLCVSACPEEAIKLDTIDKDGNEYPPCSFACPASIDMKTYFSRYKDGKIAEAARILMKNNPLAAITGRVCPRFCEKECARKDVDEPVNIKALERCVADYALEQKTNPVPHKYREKVAIAGSGPAGLSAAYFLVSKGYPVTVFEAEGVFGGMLRIGIPEYRLPRKVLDSQINYLRNMGVDFKNSILIGKDIALDELKKEYQAIFYATGNQLSRKIDLEGIRLNGVFWGLDFLRDVNLGKNVRVNGAVVVIGGGNVAVNVAITALRLGAKGVQIACLERGNQIPAYEDELEQAIEEGVKINEGWGPKRILGEGKKVSSIELVRCISTFDTDGKFNPVYDEKTAKKLKADIVILAIGQVADLSLMPDNIKSKKGNTVQADSITLETNLSGIFAGGDLVSGNGSVVEAVAAGKSAAESIDRYLRGKDMRKGRDLQPKLLEKPPREGIPHMPRQEIPLLATSGIDTDFEEVWHGFGQFMAGQEVQRCMTCGSRAVINYVDRCRSCKACEMTCPQKAISPSAIRKIKPNVKVANTWDEIARWIGADPILLKATINAYNDACNHGYDASYGKDRKYLKPLIKPPYYALKCSVSLIVSLGGIRINEHMQAVDKYDRPIPGLFIAGNDAGGWESDTYCDLLSGSTFGFAINSGRIAGENAARYILAKSTQYGHFRI